MGNSRRKLSRHSFFFPLEEMEREIGTTLPWSSSTELCVTVIVYSDREMQSATETIADPISSAACKRAWRNLSARKLG